MEIDTMSNFATLPLADRYAILKAEVDTLTKQLDAIKAEIKATGVETLTGEQAIVTVALSERSTLDAKAARTYLTPEQVAACTKVTLVETLRVKPRLAAVLA
jgi:hypothetical protein